MELFTVENRISSMIIVHNSEDEQETLLDVVRKEESQLDCLLISGNVYN